MLLLYSKDAKKMAKKVLLVSKTNFVTVFQVDFAMDEYKILHDTDEVPEGMLIIFFSKTL